MGYPLNEKCKIAFKMQHSRLNEVSENLEPTLVASWICGRTLALEITAIYSEINTRYL